MTALVQQLDSFPEPAILVPHSMSAFLVDAAAKVRHEKVRAIVYIAGILLQPGQSMLEILQTDPATGPKLLRLRLYVSRGGETFPAGEEELPHFSVVPPDVGRELLYNECTEEDAKWAVENLVAEAFLPMVTPAGGQPDSSIPRLYMLCTKDQALSPALQEEMARAAGCDMVPIDSDHSPFLSTPNELVRHILAFASAQ